MILMGYSGAQGTLIYEKKLKSKILCQTPFKRGLATFFWEYNNIKLFAVFAYPPIPLKGAQA
jgi:hypothetical protein